MTSFKHRARLSVATFFLPFAVNWSSIPALWLWRKFQRVQLSSAQLKRIVATVKGQSPCNFLVFGVGNDSALWRGINPNGRTVFLEDHPDWFKRVTTANPNLEAYLISYGTQRKEWRELMENQDRLHLELPSEIRDVEWDVILVDAPASWSDELPGRMKGVFFSSQNVTKPRHVFVHDCERDIEATYCDTFLKAENLQSEMKGAPVAGDLRHYFLNGTR